jgi:predicted transcriptional regulator
MAGPKPQDEYNPTPSVSPSTQAPNDTLSVRASPQDFGSQIGGALQGAGQDIRGAGNELFQTGMQIQGLANEHAATMAEQQLAIQGGDILEKYKSLSGMDAAVSKDKAVSDYVNLSNGIRASLTSPAAQKAYDGLATRRLSFTVQDMNSYAATQRRDAYKTGVASTMALAQDEASRIDPSENPAQFGYSLGTVQHSLNTLFTAPDFGKYQTTPVSEVDGKLKFDTSTDAGRIAQADYDNTLQQETGKVWYNAFRGMALKGNVEKTVNLLNDNKDKMPAATYSKLVQELRGPYLNDQSRRGVDGILSDKLGQYETERGASISSIPNNLGNVKQPGSDGFQIPSSPVDGAILTATNLRGGLYNGKTLADIGKTWTGESPEKAAAWASNVSRTSGIDINSVPDLNNPTVVKSLLRGIAVAEKSQQDRGLFTDDVISQGVDKAFSGEKAQLAKSSASMNPFVSKSDYLDAHAPELIQQARDTARDVYGLDTTGQDLFAERMKSRISEAHTSQVAEIRQLKNSLLQKIQDPKSPITNLMQLDNSADPVVREQWMKLQSEDYWSTQSLRNIVKGNAEGHSKSFGTSFSDHYEDMLSGKVSDVDKLADYIGGDKSPISTSGYAQLSKLQQDMQTPEGQAFAQSESQFLQLAKKTITGAGIPGINGSARQGIYEKFVTGAIPIIEGMRGEGKTSAEIFSDPKSPLWRAIEGNTPDPAKIKQMAGSEAIFNMINPPPSTVTGNPTPGLDFSKITTKDQLFANVSKMSKQEFMDHAIKLGLAAPVPEVPRPE